ncbi:hypothetical protein HYH02_009513 [Chlamydomonas schloesseri]|uniref:BHLH domain-containing protein n=1 Tax=Chlamydomonas schloesseri TaxID=2026947 RepID=A0A835W9G6_9CHLO|nr:hypothetical protein HYH02_009513 [Chlamydomonas schloesseri]|eukprot:KAG2443099.1 hypothetical protein HYH02_009513 [Chlamydomonas schloesseri]
MGPTSEALAKGGLPTSAISIDAASLAAAAEEAAAALAAATASAVTIPAPRLALKGDGTAAKSGGHHDVGRRAAGAAQQLASHSSVEKQRRDRLNDLIEELGELAPAAAPGAALDSGAKRAKHVILADAAAALRRLHQDNQVLRTHLACASRMLAAAAASVSAAGAASATAGTSATAAPAAPAAPAAAAAAAAAAIATTTSAVSAPAATLPSAVAGTGGHAGGARDGNAGDMLQRSDSGSAFGTGATAAGCAGVGIAVADAGRTGSGPVSLPLPQPAYGSLPELPGTLSASFAAAAAALQLPLFAQPSPSPPPPPPPPAVVGAAQHPPTTLASSLPPAAGGSPALAAAAGLAAVTSIATAPHAPSWLVRVVCPPHASLVAVATAALARAGPPGSVALRGVRLVPRGGTIDTQAPLVSVEMVVSCECDLLPRIQQCVSAAVNTLASCANSGAGVSNGSGSGGASAAQPRQPMQPQP